MKMMIATLLLFSLSSFALADSHVQSISVAPENPQPDTPFHIYVVVELPDLCWSQGAVGDLAYSELDSYTIGSYCSPAIFLYDILFEHEGLPEGVHTLTVTEFHSSSRDPGTWEHPVEFTVGTPPVSDEGHTWSALKALYR